MKVEHPTSTRTPQSPAAPAVPGTPAVAGTPGRRPPCHWRRWVTMLAWHGWQRLDAVMPRRVRYLVATIIGEIIYWVLPHKRAAVLRNTRHVQGPEAEPERVRLYARRSFRNYAKYLAEFAHLPRWSGADMERLVTQVDGWEHVDSAMEDGKGVIFVSSHYGNWDVAGWYFGRRYAFDAVAEPLQPPELDALVQGWRRAKHMGIIPLASAARGVLRALQKGGLVALVVDRPTHQEGDGVPVRFFGEWTCVPSGAAHFALRTGAPVVAAGAWRTPENNFRAFALPPLRFRAPYFESSGNLYRDIEVVMQRIMQDIETIIRAHPDQWYMFREMWPRRAIWDQGASSFALGASLGSGTSGSLGATPNADRCPASSGVAGSG